MAEQHCVNYQEPKTFICYAGNFDLLDILSVGRDFRGNLVTFFLHRHA
jgi:hypothetical protein